jgi:DNA-binding MarR family transcriptional regulator
MRDGWTADRIIDSARRLDVALAGLDAAVARDIGISVPELLALENLAAEGDMGPSELARRLQLSTGAVTALVDRLAAGGHAARAAHPTDRRRVVVTPTAQATSALAAQAAPLERDLHRLVESMSPEERAAVGGFLEAFLGIVERATQEACLA